MRTRVLAALVPGMLALLLAQSACAAGAPQISETWVTDVTTTSANLRAKVDPEGTSTSYRFEYVTQIAYEAGGFAGAQLAPPSGTALLGPGSTAIPVVQHVGSLAPETSYRYRVSATSSAGTEYGAARLLTTAAPTSAFPPIDGRRYELVSPADKEGGSVGAPESIFGGGDFQAAAGGGSFTFSSTSSFGEAAGTPPAGQYVSIRGGSGWVTRNVSAPLEAGGYGDRPDGVPYRVFSGDLSRALMLDPRRCAVEPCPRSYSLRDSATGAGVPLPAEAAGLRVLDASPDLGRILFEGRSGEVYEWSGGGLVPTSRLPAAAGPAATFQAESADDRFIFYSEGGNLYRYDTATGTPVDITPAAGVVGVLGISAAGGVVYYQDGSGLERWGEGEGTSTVVPGASVADPSDYPPATATARVSADGEDVAFVSSAEIPPFDNTDAETGLPDTEIYIYGPPPGGGAPRLVCASCNPTGERPSGAASIPGTVRNGSSVLYRPRVLAADGSRLFFDSADPLVVPDTDARPDVYEWEATGVGDCTRFPGCLGLISGGRGEGGTFLDASESGDDVFFLTGESLVGADPGSIDVYDDRVGGGFPEPEAPFVCKGDACQALPSPPEDPSPATLASTAGNPPLKIEKLKPRKRHRRRPHKHARHPKHRRRHKSDHRRSHGRHR